MEPFNRVVCLEMVKSRQIHETQILTLEHCQILPTPMLRHFSSFLIQPQRTLRNTISSSSTGLPTNTNSNPNPLPNSNSNPLPNSNPNSNPNSYPNSNSNKTLFTIEEPVEEEVKALDLHRLFHVFTSIEEIQGGADNTSPKDPTNPPPPQPKLSPKQSSRSPLDAPLGSQTIAGLGPEVFEGTVGRTTKPTMANRPLPPREKYSTRTGPFLVLL